MESTRPLRLVERGLTGAEIPLTRQAQPSLEALTSLRFFAAVHVMLYHLLPTGFVEDRSSALARIVQIGYVAVSFFFVLSGFILVYAYLPAHEAGKLNARTFWAARFARIYPVYAVAMALAFLFWLPHIGLGHPSTVLEALVRCLTLTQAWGPQAGTYVLVPAWSLSVEAFFYLCFPFLLPTFARLSCGQAWAMVGLCSAAAWIAPSIYTAVGFAGPTHSYWEDFFKFLPVFHLPAFLAGMGLGVAYRRTPKEVRLATRWWAFAGIGIVAIAVAGWAPYGPKYLFLHDGALVLPAGLLIYGLACHPKVPLLTHPSLVLLGEASYSLYILHMDVASIVGAVMAKLVHLPTGTWVFAVVAGVLSVFVSLLVYRSVELPARSWIRKHADMRVKPLRLSPPIRGESAP